MVDLPVRGVISNNQQKDNTMSHPCLIVQGRPQSSRFWEYSADNCGSFKHSIRTKLSKAQKADFDLMLYEIKNGKKPNRAFLLSMLDLFKDDYPAEKQYFCKLWYKSYGGKPETITK